MHLKFHRCCFRHHLQLLNGLGSDRTILAKSGTAYCKFWDLIYKCSHCRKYRVTPLWFFQMVISLDFSVFSWLTYFDPVFTNCPTSLIVLFLLDLLFKKVCYRNALAEILPNLYVHNSLSKVYFANFFIPMYFPVFLLDWCQSCFFLTEMFRLTPELFFRFCPTFSCI